MDNAPYHSTVLNKIPTKYYVKRSIMEWLIENKTQFSKSMRKYELFNLIVLNKPKKINSLLMKYLTSWSQSFTNATLHVIKMHGRKIKKTGSGET